MCPPRPICIKVLLKIFRIELNFFWKIDIRQSVLEIIVCSYSYVHAAFTCVSTEQNRMYEIFQDCWSGYGLDPDSLTLWIRI
jgi:hypothetical protein